MNGLVYDIEIIKAVPGREPRVDGIEYCEGWDDHQNMGVSCICAYDYKTSRFRVFTAERFAEFGELMRERSPLIGHNIIGFDNKVLHACGISQPPLESFCYDTLVELWVGAGLGRTWSGSRHAGFSLDATALANFGQQKTGHGALAPVDWQRGLWGKVIDYCLEDVRLTKRLFERMAFHGFVVDPRDTDRVIYTRKLGE